MSSGLLQRRNQEIEAEVTRDLSTATIQQFRKIAVNIMNSNSIIEVYEKVKADYVKDTTAKTQV